MFVCLFFSSEQIQQLDEALVVIISNNFEFISCLYMMTLLTMDFVQLVTQKIAHFLTRFSGIKAVDGQLSCIYLSR